MGKILRVFGPILILIFSISSEIAAQQKAAVALPKGESTANEPLLKRRENLDGVYVEAVESYPYQNHHQIDLGFGLYPFNSYYTGFGLNGGYTFQFNESFAWEILNGSYFFTFDKDLTSQLAENFRARTETIDRIRYLLTSNFAFVHTHGKFVFLKNYIRYFRTSVFLGPGLVSTKQENKFATNLGLKLGVFLSDRFSWNIEFRDAIAVKSFTNYLTFGLSTGMSF